MPEWEGDFWHSMYLSLAQRYFLPKEEMPECIYRSHGESYHHVEKYDLLHFGGMESLAQRGGDA